MKRPARSKLMLVVAGVAGAKAGSAPGKGGARGGAGPANPGGERTSRQDRPGGLVDGWPVVLWLGTILQ